MITQRTTTNRAIGAKWSLRQASNCLKDTRDDLRAIRKDKHYQLTHDERKDMRELISEMLELLPELKEKI